MTPYLVCYATLFASLALGLFLGKLRLAAFVAFVPMLILIAGRGLVGTDSAVYVQEFDVIRYRGILASRFEPGFSVLVDILTYVYSDSFDILILLSTVTALLMFTAGMLLERTPVLFMTVVLPFFMLDMTMNGLRYGLAFAIAAIGVVFLERGKVITFIACGAIAASIQVSSVALAIGIWALTEVRAKTALGIAAGSIAAFIFFGEYIENKIAQNSDISGVGGAAGIVTLIATALIIASLRFRNRFKQNNVALFIILVVQVLAFGISRYYYAGLRVQSLMLFFLYLFSSAMIFRSNIDIVRERVVVFALGLVMLITSASRLNNFSDDDNGFSPFNPFYFSREIVR